MTRVKCRNVCACGSVSEICRRLSFVILDVVCDLARQETEQMRNSFRFSIPWFFFISWVVTWMWIGVMNEMLSFWLDKMRPGLIEWMFRDQNTSEWNEWWDVWRWNGMKCSGWQQTWFVGFGAKKRARAGTPHSCRLLRRGAVQEKSHRISEEFHRHAIPRKF